MLSALNNSLIDKVSKTGDTLTGTFTVTNGSQSAKLFADGEGGTLELTQPTNNRAVHHDMLSGNARTYLYQPNPWAYKNDLIIKDDQIYTQSDFVNGNGVSLNGLKSSLGTCATANYTDSLIKDSNQPLTSGGAYNHMAGLITIRTVSFGSQQVTYCQGKVLTKSCALTGYTPIGIISCNTGDVATFVVTYGISGTNASITLSSADNSTRTCSPSVMVLYVKTYS